MPVKYNGAVQSLNHTNTIIQSTEKIRIIELKQMELSIIYSSTNIKPVFIAVRILYNQDQIVLFKVCLWFPRVILSLSIHRHNFKIIRLTTVWAKIK